MTKVGLMNGADLSDLAVATGLVLGILALITVIYGALRQFRPSQSLPKIGSRIRFLWGMALFYLLALLYSPQILLLYVAFIAFLALKEYLSITPTRRADRRVLFWAYLSIPIQFFLIWMDWRRLFTLFVPVHVFLVLPVLMVMVGETRGFLKAWSMLGWGILTTVFSLGYLGYLAVLLPGTHGSGNGLGLFLFLVSLAQLNYAAQYFFGKRFRHPRLSLKITKTRNWASLVGSILVSAPVAWLVAPWMTPFTPGQAVLSGVVIAVGAFIGYLILSAIKADLQLKDRGTMTPGSGGVMNRIDAFVYTAPLFFYIVTQWFG